MSWTNLLLQLGLLIGLPDDFGLWEKAVLVPGSLSWAARDARR